MATPRGPRGAFCSRALPVLANPLVCAGSDVLYGGSERQTRRRTAGFSGLSSPGVTWHGRCKVLVLHCSRFKTRHAGGNRHARYVDAVRLKIWRSAQARLSSAVGLALIALAFATPASGQMRAGLRGGLSISGMSTDAEGLGFGKGLIGGGWVRTLLGGAIAIQIDDYHPQNRGGPLH